MYMLGLQSWLFCVVGENCGSKQDLLRFGSGAVVSFVASQQGVLGLNPQAGGVLCSVCMLSLYLIGFSGYSDSKFAVAVNVIWIRGEEIDGWKIF